jgi:hypothetical protein
MLIAAPVNIDAPALGDVIVEVGVVVSWITVTLISVGGSCTFPLLSTARLLIAACPGVVGVIHIKLHDVVPVAALKVAPPSTDTSTRATIPPSASLAVPVMLITAPVITVAPGAGKVIAEVGVVVSWITVTLISAGGSCKFPLSSTARLLIVACPGVVGVIHVKLHDVVPVAALKVAPPSTDTSTRATVPPPASLAVPVILTMAPVITVAPGAGEVIVEVGRVISRTVTVISVGGSCWFSLSSTARLLILACPDVVGVQLKLHAVVPVAALKVAPPSTDTSTRATVPPPASLAVPVILTVAPVITVAPCAGEVIVEVGRVISRAVMVISVGGSCTFPLLSTARLLILTCPGVAGVKLKLHAVVPVAALKVAPPSTDTSTRATVPPPASLAVPVMLTAVPVDTVAPDAGEVIAEVGAILSGVGVGFGMTVRLLIMPHPE